MMTKKWTDEEIELLKSGRTPPNRSINSIKVMKKRLGIVKFKKTTWTQENKNKLKELLAQGKTTKEISFILPHTQRSIQKEIARQKIPHKTQVKFTKIEKDVFNKFLIDNWEGKTTRELVDLWNGSNKRKVNERKAVIYLKKMNLKIAKSEVTKMTWLKKREKEWLVERDIDSIKKRRMRIMMERYSKKLDIWSGLSSSEIDSELELD